MYDSPKKQEARVILQPLEEALDAAGNTTAKTDARCLLGLALGRDTPVMPHEDISPLDKAGQNCLLALLQRRLNGEPVSRIRGWREFWSLRFTISSATLDPRPESETVIEAAVKWASVRSAQNGPLRCLDLGTGSGCLLLALLSELPQAIGIGIDLNRGAVDVAAASNRLGLPTGRIFTNIAFVMIYQTLVTLIYHSIRPYTDQHIVALDVDVRSYDPALV